MTARDVNIAHLKRLKTSYELRAKELELQAALYRLDASKPFSLPHSRHYHRRGPPVVPMTPEFEDDDCHCNADIGYNTPCTFRDEGRSAYKKDQSGFRGGDDESATSLDLDLATLSTIKQLVTRERETKRRIARLDKVEEVILSLMKETPLPHKNDQQANTEREGKSDLDSDIQSDVARMKEVVDHLALKVKEPVDTEQEELVVNDTDNAESCQSESPNAELISNLPETVQDVNAKTTNINSTEKMVPNQRNAVDTTEEDAETVFVHKAPESVTEDESDERNDRMEIMKRNVNLVVDHLKVCNACPVEEFENINCDLVDILGIFNNMHDENSHPKESETSNARDTTDTEKGARQEGSDVVVEQIESAMEIIDEIIARAAHVVCEKIIQETDVSLQMTRQPLEEEHPLPNFEDITPNTEIVTELAEAENKTQKVSPFETAYAQPKFNCCSACACLTEDTASAQPMLLAELGTDKVPEEVSQVENTPEESVAAVDEAPEEVAPAEEIPTNPVPVVGESVGCQTAITFTGRCKVNVPTICLSSKETCATVAKRIDGLKNTCKCKSLEKDKAKVLPEQEKESQKLIPSEEKPLTIIEPPLTKTPAVKSPVARAEDIPTNPVSVVGESVGCQTALTFTGRCKVNVPTICLSSKATCATVAKHIDGLKNKCKCKSLEKDKAKVLPEQEKESQKLIPSEEKPLPVIEPPLTETPAVKSPEDMILTEPTAASTPITSEELPDKVPLATTAPPADVIQEEITAEPSPEQIPHEPSKESIPLDALEEQALAEPFPDLGPIEPLEEPTVVETASKLSHEEPIALPPPIETVEEQAPGAPETAEEIPSKPSDTAISPADVQSPSNDVSSKNVVKSPEPTRSPEKTPSLEKPRKPSDSFKSPAKTASTPISAKQSKEKSPIKSVSSPIAAKSSTEKNPVKSVSYSNAAKTSREKSPVKSVSSPIETKTAREKSPVKSTMSPVAIKPNKDKIPEKSGSTSSAAKPSYPKQSPERISPIGSVVNAKPIAAKRPTTPSTKVHRPSIGSVGSRSSARSKSSKKSDVQQKSGCTCKMRQECPCKTRGAKNDVTTGMCPSSPQKKCSCRKPSSRRESSSKGRGASRVNVDAPAEGSLIPANKKCFCSQWAKYRENHLKFTGQKDEKDQQKPQVTNKNCKSTHKKLK